MPSWMVCWLRNKKQDRHMFTGRIPVRDCGLYFYVESPFAQALYFLKIQDQNKRSGE